MLYYMNFKFADLPTSHTKESGAVEVFLEIDPRMLDIMHILTKMNGLIVDNIILNSK